MAGQKKILIVEDDKFLLEMLVARLKEQGFAILEARDGERALELALGEQPDLILLDLILPVMDGITMLKKLREREQGRKTNVVILTNLSDSEDVEEAVRAGVHDYLVKTQWMPDDLIRKVKEKCG